MQKRKKEKCAQRQSFSRNVWTQGLQSNIIVLVIKTTINVIITTITTTTTTTIITTAATTTIATITNTISIIIKPLTSQHALLYASRGGSRAGPAPLYTPRVNQQAGIATFLSHTCNREVLKKNTDGARHSKAVQSAACTNSSFILPACVA